MKVRVIEKKKKNIFIRLKCLNLVNRLQLTGKAN